MAAALQSTLDLLPSGEPREFHFTDRDFDQIKSLIYQHAGIHLTSAKREMVYSRLSRRLRA